MICLSLTLQATWCWTAAARWRCRQPACSSSPGCSSSTCCPGASSTGSSHCRPTLPTPRHCCSCSSCSTSCRRPSPSRWARIAQTVRSGGPTPQSNVCVIYVWRILLIICCMALFLNAAHQPSRDETSVCGENLPLQVVEVFGGRV